MARMYTQRCGSSTSDSSRGTGDKADLGKWDTALQISSHDIRQSSDNSKSTEGDRAAGGEESRKSAVEYFSTFTGRTFLEGQEESISKIDEAFKRYRFVLADLPTGSGKSYVGMCFALQSGNAHILTPQKILQDQYATEEVFAPHVFVMKGKSNYACQVREVDTLGNEIQVSCVEGECNRNKDRRLLKGCPYRKALAIAAKHPIVVHNFDSFYYQSRAHIFGARKLMVVDEAHNIEGKFLNFVSFSISNWKDRTEKIPKFDKIAQYDDFLSKKLVALHEEHEFLFQKLDDEGSITKAELKRKNELEDVIEKLAMYLRTRETAEYVFDWVDHRERDYQSVTFRPVFVGDFVKNRLLPFGERVLMMSATVGDKKLFCKSVGLNPDEVAYITTPSHFPVKNRPIVKRYVGSMNFASRDETLPKLVKEITKLLAKHPSRKGIIHTGSELVARYIQANLFDPRLTFNKDYPSVDEMMRVHTEKEGSFIVASGLREGLDLKGDLSRVQIIAKIPYPDLGDKRVARRKAIDPSWYGYMTALSFVQSIGRSVRSKTDKAITYVLDESFENFVHWNRKFIPKYVVEAIRRQGHHGR